MNIWKFIQSKLLQDIDVMLMLVIQSSGSSPGKPGFKMVVTKNKELYGTIGGGNAEHEMVELAHSLIKTGGIGPFLKKLVHHPQAVQNNSGMICSGSQDIVFFPIYNDMLKTIDAIVDGAKTGKGSIKISKQAIEFCTEDLYENQISTKVIGDEDWEYLEKPGKPNKICIIGAGHVGRALSKIMKDLDFKVELYDDRFGLNTFENNEYVNKKHKINYNDIDNLIKEGDHVYVVIMTFGHESDELVLSKLIGKRFKYIGMLGSKVKVEKIFENIGHDPSAENATKVHSPIGLAINSQTPAEIAISIAAEIIKIKNDIHADYP
jgi:xanthine dehydrogenase accessory factor